MEDTTPDKKLRRLIQFLIQRLVILLDLQPLLIALDLRT